MGPQPRDQYAEISLAEAAHVLGISSFRCRSLILSQKLDGRMMGRFWVVTAASVEAYQAQQANAT